MHFDTVLGLVISSRQGVEFTSGFQLANRYSRVKIRRVKDEGRK